MRYLKIPVSILFKPFEAFKPGQFMGFEGRVLFGVLWIDEQTETKCKKLFKIELFTYYRTFLVFRTPDGGQQTTS